MAANLDDLIAGSLDADPALMPVLDYLLQDLDVLGGDPDQIVGMMRPLRMTGKVRMVLDLGCGKGTISTALASELGLHVTGIDAFRPFVDEARTRASAMGIAERCLFQAADMRQLVGRLPQFDAVLLIACGPIFGDARTTAAALRTFVRPGGFIVVAGACRMQESGANDAGVKEAGVNDTGPERSAPAGSNDWDFPSHDAAAAALTAYGDRIVMEKHGAKQEAEGGDERAVRVLEQRARELMSLYPGLHASMWDYIDAYRRDARRQRKSLVPAAWIVQKAADEPS